VSCSVSGSCRTGSGRQSFERAPSSGRKLVDRWPKLLGRQFAYNQLALEAVSNITSVRPQPVDPPGLFFKKKKILARGFFPFPPFQPTAVCLQACRTSWPCGCLDLGKVSSVPRSKADQCATGEDHLRREFQYRLLQIDGRVGHRLPPSRYCLITRVDACKLEFIKGRQVRVAVGTDPRSATTT